MDSSENSISSFSFITLIVWKQIRWYFFQIIYSIINIIDAELTAIQISSVLLIARLFHHLKNGIELSALIFNVSSDIF